MNQSIVSGDDEKDCSEISPGVWIHDPTAVSSFLHLFIAAKRKYKEKHPANSDTPLPDEFGLDQG